MFVGASHIFRYGKKIFRNCSFSFEHEIAYGDSVFALNSFEYVDLILQRNSSGNELATASFTCDT